MKRLGVECRRVGWRECANGTNLPELSQKLGTYKLTGLCDIPVIAVADFGYCICSMAALPIDTENLLNLGARGRVLCDRAQRGVQALRCLKKIPK